MPRTGRPEIEIDWEQFEKLCAIQCTMEEIAGWFGCCIDTIENRVKKKYDATFSEVFKKYAAPGRISLRRKQFSVATEGKGNVAMLIWLGKQWLNQKERVDLVSAHEVDMSIYKKLEKLSLKDLRALAYENNDTGKSCSKQSRKADISS